MKPAKLFAFLFLGSLTVPVVGQVLPFRDDFDDAHDDGMPVEWRMAGNGAGSGGTRAVEDGYFIISGDGYTASFVDEAEGTGDVSLEAAVNIREGGLWSFAARASAGNVYWGGLWSDGEIFLAETASFVNTFHGEIDSGLNPTENDVRLRMEVIDLEDGSVSLSLYAWDQGESIPSTPQLQYVDNRLKLSSGAVGMVVNGGSPTTAAIDYYAAWVPSIADFGDDGQLDCLDVDALTAEIAAGTDNSEFDLTGDGFVQQDDLTEWLRLAGERNLASGNSYLSGDANLDGVVDVGDFNAWNDNKFTAIAGWCSGDFNADGFVDVGDFNIWNDNKFTSADIATVPEPDGLAMFVLFCAIVALRKQVSICIVK